MPLHKNSTSLHLCQGVYAKVLWIYPRLQPSSNAAEQIEDTIAEIVNDIDTLEQEHRDILGKRGDYANTLTLVTDALPSGTYFTSMEIHANQVTVEGEADSFFTVISYAMVLEAQTGFSEVRIAEIDDSSVVEGEEAETTRVSFSIIIHTITKQD